jgi:hypothetical protein
MASLRAPRAAGKCALKGDWSKLALQINWRTSGVARLLEPVIVRGAAGQMNRELQELKRLVEANR